MRDCCTSDEFIPNVVLLQVELLLMLLLFLFHSFTSLCDYFNKELSIVAVGFIANSLVADS